MWRPPGRRHSITLATRRNPRLAPPLPKAPHSRRCRRSRRCGEEESSASDVVTGNELVPSIPVRPSVRSHFDEMLVLIGASGSIWPPWIGGEILDMLVHRRSGRLPALQLAIAELRQFRMPAQRIANLHPCRREGRSP
jgi:hypothetical protein